MLRRRAFVDISVHRLDQFRREDFYRVHSEGHEAALCFCAAWWLDSWDDWEERTAEDNRAVREDLFARGVHDGYLLYVDGEPRGWIQCGPLEWFPKLVAKYGLEPSNGDWAITCFLLPPNLRGKGLAHRFLEEVVEALRFRGVEFVWGFPRRGSGIPEEEIWTGTVPLFEGAGFDLEVDNEHHPAYGKCLWFCKDVTSEGEGSPVRRVHFIPSSFGFEMALGSRTRGSSTS
jgi:GNAT superfamily N-acetyltransferase